jgi:hypothetical protein
MIKKLFWLLAIVLVLAGVWKMFGDKLPASWKVWRSEVSFYVVHLTNGQVYYGRLKSVSDSTIKLEDVYYFEMVKEAAPVATSQNFALQGQEQTIYRLTRRGSEKPATTDHDLYINRAVVLFWEKLNADSDMMTMIGKAEEQK